MCGWGAGGGRRRPPGGGVGWSLVSPPHHPPLALLREGRRSTRPGSPSRCESRGRSCDRGASPLAPTDRAHHTLAQRRPHTAPRAARSRADSPLTRTHAPPPSRHERAARLVDRSCMSIPIRLRKTLWVWGPLRRCWREALPLSPPKESQTLSRGPCLSSDIIEFEPVRTGTADRGTGTHTYTELELVGT